MTQTSDATSPPPGAVLQLHQPLKSWFQVTQACNLKCKQCYGDCEETQAPGELTATEFRQLIDQMSEAGVIELLVEGGEPLQRQDVLEILSYAAPKMLVRLRTNGTLIDHRMIERIKGAGIAHVCVDFMGASDAVHDWHVGVPGAFQRSLTGLRTSLEAGLNTVALIIMTRRNVDELQDFIDLMVAEGIRRVGILRLYPLGRARRSWKELALPLSEQMAALDRLVIPDELYLMRSWHPKDANCCWQSSGVDARGRSVGCSYLRDFVDYGNVREMPYLETWNHPLYVRLRGRDVDDHCPECASTQGSPGGCRSTAFAFTGNWSAPDPFCTHTNNGIDTSRLPPERGIGR